MVLELLPKEAHRSSIPAPSRLDALQEALGKFGDTLAREK